jgi:2-succinyl-6-hydroxy-2,4-cyclohexadiene-1-carboxylate synthase
MTDHSAPLHRLVEGAGRPDPPAPAPPVGALQPRPPVAGAPEREGSRPGERGRGAVHTPADPRPGASDPRPGPADPRPRSSDPRPGPADPRPGVSNTRPGPADPRPGPGDRRPRLPDPRLGPSDPAPGAGVAGRVVLVHGFTQTLAAWGPVGERLVGRWQVVRVDLPGHGGSGGVRVGFAEAAGLLGEAGGPGVYCGYSLGGRLCLRLALDRPDLVRGLVLVGASPGIADPGARAERRVADEALAGRIEREGVAAFLDRWLAGPLFATLPAAAAGRADRLANTAEGLAYALRRLGTGAQEPLWDRLATLQPPTLLVAGALDAKFTAIATDMAAAIGPRARVALVPGAGHAVHLERPAELAALVEDFLGAGRPDPPAAP